MYFCNSQLDSVTRNFFRQISFLLRKLIIQYHLARVENTKPFTSNVCWAQNQRYNCDPHDTNYYIIVCIMTTISKCDLTHV